ncbi:MAG: hypothetical protein KF754_11425 [Planctomycetes bacterium]|nr:hypothetical protein [Planctomycetota bacterium]
MTRNLSLLLLVLTCLVAGCKTTDKTKVEWGETYTDVVVPAGYEAYGTPPFKRTDGADGKRIFGRYAYRNKEGMDKPSRLAAWFKKELPKQGWEHQVEEANDEKGTMTLRYIKNDDRLVLKLAPDNQLNKSDRFSVLTVEMNPPFDN